MIPKLEELARELETLNRPDLAGLISQVRDDSFDRANLIDQMLALQLGFPASKLKNGYYDSNYAAYCQHLEELSNPTPEVPDVPVDPATPEITPEETPTTEAAGEVREEIDIKELPKCEACVHNDKFPAEPRRQDHSFMTYNHPYEDPAQPAQEDGRTEPTE